MRLKDRIALVTGAGRGIGRGISEALAAEGAQLVINDVRRDAANEVAAALKERGTQTLAAPADVSDSGEVDAMVQAALDRFGRLDILVNNAGISQNSPFLSITEAEFDRTINIDLKAIFLCSQAAARAMERTGGGAIVNITSVCGEKVWLGNAHYCTAKAGANMLTQAMAAELAPLSIRVNAIAPGTVDTEMSRADVSDPDEADWVVRRTPAGRIGEPEDIARFVVFLASDEANWLNGQILTVDGGYSLLGDPLV